MRCVLILCLVATAGARCNPGGRWTEHESSQGGFFLAAGCNPLMVVLFFGFPKLVSLEKQPKTTGTIKELQQTHKFVGGNSIGSQSHVDLSGGFKWHSEQSKRHLGCFAQKSSHASRFVGWQEDKLTLNNNNHTYTYTYTPEVIFWVICGGNA